MKLKEALIRADMSDNKVRELSTELETIVDRLKESERHAGDLTVSFSYVQVFFY